jgi:hypothetical protein
LIHFGAATQLDEDTNQRPYDGIIGLGFESIHKHEHAVSSLLRPFQFPVFVYYLLRAANAPNSIEHRAGQISVTCHFSKRLDHKKLKKY